jgi:hypothetical protein
LKIIPHIFEGQKEKHPVIVVVDAKGDVKTSLAEKKSAPVIECRSPVCYVQEQWASIRMLSRNAGTGKASQMVRLVPDEGDDVSAKALKLLDLRQEWARYYFENGTSKSDPRKKQIESMRKGSFETFEERFCEMIEMPGAPYFTAFAKGDGTMALRKKPCERKWDNGSAETVKKPGKHDHLIGNVDELLGSVDYDAEVVLIDLNYKGKSLIEDYDTVMDKIEVVYVNFYMKLVWSEVNKTATLMTTPRQIVVGGLGPSRSSGSAASEAAVDIFGAISGGEKRKASTVDIMEVLKSSGEGGKKARK